jgi:hypothetical protein
MTIRAFAVLAALALAIAPGAASAQSVTVTGEPVQCGPGQVGRTAQGRVFMCLLASMQRFRTPTGQNVACMAGRFAYFDARGLAECRLAENAAIATPAGAISCRAGGDVAFGLGHLKNCLLDQPRSFRDASGRLLHCRAGGLVHFREREGGAFMTCNL